MIRQTMLILALATVAVAQPKPAHQSKEEALDMCNLMYGYCVEQVAKAQEMYNGCALTKDLPLTLSIPVIERKTFSDIKKCQADESACGYTRMAWHAEISKCLFK